MTRVRSGARANPLLLCCALIVAAGFALVPVAAEAQDAEAVHQLAAARMDAERDHLWRVAAWGGLNAAGGLALVLSTRRAAHPARFGFGLQAGVWGVVNLGIAVPGLIGGAGTTTSAFAEALAAERGLHDLLLLNMGLNVAYAGVGAAMVVAGYRGVKSAEAWRGHGTALIVQGLGLLVLDGVALLASRARLADLLSVAGHVSGRAAPGGFALVF